MESKLVNRKELAAIMGISYSMATWYTRHMQNQGKRGGMLVYELDPTVKLVQEYMKGPKWSKTRPVAPIPVRKQAPTFDDLPFVEQRRIRAERERLELEAKSKKRSRK